MDEARWAGAGSRAARSLHPSLGRTNVQRSAKRDEHVFEISVYSCLVSTNNVHPTTGLTFSQSLYVCCVNAAGTLRQEW